MTAGDSGRRVLDRITVSRPTAVGHGEYPWLN
jgi:hypothetical protein